MADDDDSTDNTTSGKACAISTRRQSMGGQRSACPGHLPQTMSGFCAHSASMWGLDKVTFACHAAPQGCRWLEIRSSLIDEHSVSISLKISQLYCEIQHGFRQTF